jgi:hypothetical protein
MTDPTYVVAGNGSSLAHPQPGCILAGDRIVRTNNFFFEPQSFLGRRVDLAVMGGDPRVAPFMFETLWQCRDTYDVRAWTSHNPAVVRAGRRRFGTLYQPLRYGSGALAEQVQTLIAHYGCKPMTGTYAVLAAHGQGAGQGAGHILLTGMDFYTAEKRYTHDTGKNHTALLGRDLNTRKIDADQHNTELDLAILALVQEQTDGALRRTTSGSKLDTIMDLAPVRAGAAPEISLTDPPDDWASRAGLYPITLLKGLRYLRRVTRRSST